MQKPLMHWPLAVQVLPFALGALVHTPLASQNRPWVVSDAQVPPARSSSPVGVFEQVPRFELRLHTRQGVLQAVSQQTPSAQKPLAHSAPVEHMRPIRLLHCWALSQAWSLVQVSSGWPAGTLAQVPSELGTLQARQVPAH
jgi:hypothetical protein